MSHDRLCIIWDEDQFAELETLDELEACLKELDKKYGEINPVTAIVSISESKAVYFGIGGHLSYVSSCEPPYFTTVGDPLAEGEKSYSLQGHHSPIPNANLIPKDVVLEILREFCSSGKLPVWQAWTEI
jgi:hypothetical protein